MKIKISPNIKCDPFYKSLVHYSADSNANELLIKIHFFPLLSWHARRIKRASERCQLRALRRAIIPLAP